MNSGRKIISQYFSLIFINLLRLSIAYFNGNTTGNTTGNTAGNTTGNTVTGNTTGNETKKSILPGDIIIGGLFPIHSRDEGEKECGELNFAAIQRLEIMLFTLDQINGNTSILPGIKLGALIYDTCDTAPQALVNALEFVRASFNKLNPYDFVCKDGSAAEAKYTPASITGVIGGTSSSISIHVANLLRLFKIPQISYASTSIALSNKKRFQYFARTVPPDTYQAKAMAELIRRLNWTYVSTIASEGEYGESGVASFLTEASVRNICVALNLKIHNHAKRNEILNLVSTLLKMQKAKVVVMFVRMGHIHDVLQAATDLKATGKFIWIACDQWGRNVHPIGNNHATAEGALSIELDASLIPPFDKYFLNLNPLNNKRNPWFAEYWAEFHNCSWKNQSDTSRMCNGTELFGFYEQERKSQFVYDAVYAMALALHKLQQYLCPKEKGFCPGMKEIDGEMLFKSYILNSSFYNKYGSLVQIDSKGDAHGRYKIYNYAYDHAIKHYDFKHVATWSKVGLEFTDIEIRWKRNSTSRPESICSRTCEFNERKSQRNRCCWKCLKCAEFEYLKDEFTCIDCGLGQWPLPNMQSCYYLEDQFMSWYSIYSIAPLLLSCLGIIGTIGVIATFIRYNNTPVVMASGRELSYMLLCGCLICYLMSFILIAKPSIIVCCIQQIGVGFGFAIIYAALLTRTNRISRIFYQARHSAQRTPYISPRSQIAIASILISIQIVFTIIWLILEPPGIRRYYPFNKRDEIILRCNMRETSFLISLIYNMILIAICTVYAVKTRNIPANFNESKFIGFAMYTTCIIWLAFIPIYFGTLNTFQVQIITLCFAISFSATVAILWLFLPKMYIILLHPERNVRKPLGPASGFKKPPTTAYREPERASISYSTFTKSSKELTPTKKEEMSVESL